jgi:hypothetical protein
MASFFLLALFGGNTVIEWKPSLFQEISAKTGELPSEQQRFL